MTIMEVINCYTDRTIRINYINDNKRCVVKSHGMELINSITMYCSAHKIPMTEYYNHINDRLK